MNPVTNPIPSATSSTVLLAANPRRRGFIIENSDPNRLFVTLGAEAVSATDYSFSVAQYRAVERTNYVGEIRGIWGGDGAGFAHVTEY